MAKPTSAKLWIIPILILILGASGYYFFQKKSAPKPEFSTVSISRGSIIQSVAATGTLQPVTTVEISSQISGLILEVNVDYNSVAKQGDLLARIDPATYQVKLNSAEAQRSNAQANYTLVKLNTERTRALFAKELVSQQELDQAEAQLTQAQAQLKIQEASVQTAKVDLERCNIYAPITGIIMDRAAEVGKTVAASLNAPKLFTMAADLSKMQIEAAISEGDIGLVQVGQDVEFSVDAYTNRRFQGRVTQIRNSPVTTQNVVTYTAIIDVNNDDLKLKPGMTANVSVIIIRKDNVLRVPNSALRVRIPESLLGSTTPQEKPASAPTTTAVPATREQIRQIMIEAGVPATKASTRLTPELRAKVIEIAQEMNVELPSRILQSDEENTATTRTIYKLDGNTTSPKAIPLSIQTGITDGSMTEIIQGAEDGDVIVSNAYQPSPTATAPTINPFSGSTRSGYRH